MKDILQWRIRRKIVGLVYWNCFAGRRKWIMMLITVFLGFAAALTRYQGHIIPFNQPGEKLVGDHVLTLDVPSGKQERTLKYCSHFTCFDIYRCNAYGDDQISVYSYPDIQLRSNGYLAPLQTSHLFRKVKAAVEKSPYYTGTSANACVLFPPVDLLYPHPSKYKNISAVLAALPQWNGGLNHLILTMRCDVVVTKDLRLGKAMIAAPGFLRENYRKHFDVSIPFLHPTVETPQFRRDQGDRRWLLGVIELDGSDNYVASADLFNITDSSDTLHLFVRAGKDLTFRSKSAENSPDFPRVLTDITFCFLTPGLQPFLLGTVLSLGCIPVLLDSDLIMPFEEVLDWKRVAVFLQPGRVSEGIEILRSLDGSAISAKRALAMFFFRRYMSSLEKILETTIEVLNSRLFPVSARTYAFWNTPSETDNTIPTSRLQLLPGIVPKNPGFTAVILAYDREENLAQLVALLERCPSLQKIVIVWNNQEKPVPSGASWPKLTVTYEVIQTRANKLTNRFFPYDSISTDAVLSLDDDILMLNPDEIEFGFQVWSENSDRLVGFPSRLHVWNASSNVWVYKAEWGSQISIVLTGATFYSQLYNYYFTHKLPRRVLRYIDDHMNCEDIAMNFLVANVTGKGPIKVGPRKKFRCPQCSNRDMLSADYGHLSQRSECINYFASEFGFMSLIPMEFRADPVLFKEPVSIAEHRYPNIGAL